MRNSLPMGLSEEANSAPPWSHPLSLTYLGFFIITQFSSFGVDSVFLIGRNQLTYELGVDEEAKVKSK